jgi:UPF0176 protein
VSRILNISAYRFVSLPDAAELRPRIERAATEAELKGTVLLAEEGFNMFLAGAEANLRNWLAWLRTIDRRFAELPTKDSWSDEVPFRRLLVKLKREIIRMDRPTIRPAIGRAPAVDAQTLARWLDVGHDDNGRPVLLLDTRNRFEVELGRFRNAIDLQASRFSELPALALQRRAEFHGKTVVSYCTGGIRCEKAALFLAESGIEDVVQLDGGILAYFEQVGGRHFDGACFVFDQRIAVDARLQAAR